MHEVVFDHPGMDCRDISHSDKPSLTDIWNSSDDESWLSVRILGVAKMENEPLS